MTAPLVTVVAAALVVRSTDGRETYLYKGEVFPDNVEKDEVNRLVAMGLAERGEDVVVPAVVSAPVVTASAGTASKSK